MVDMVLVRIRNIQPGKTMARIASRVDLKIIDRRVKGDVEIKWYTNITFGPIGNFSQLYSCEEWELVETRPLCKRELYSSEIEKILQNEKWER